MIFWNISVSTDQLKRYCVQKLLPKREGSYILIFSVNLKTKHYLTSNFNSQDRTNMIWTGSLTTTYSQKPNMTPFVKPLLSIRGHPVQVKNQEKEEKPKPYIRELSIWETLNSRKF